MRSEPPIQKELALNIRQFAERIGFTREWVSRLIKKGDIMPRIGPLGAKYFLQSDVEDWKNETPNVLFKNRGIRAVAEETSQTTEEKA